jgi:hypothetical protein
MKLIKGIRNKARAYFLHKKLSAVKRNRKLVSINAATSVGILFELTDQETYFSVQKYLQKLQEKKVKVKALGYASNKVVTSQFLPVLTFDFFKDKQVNWIGFPKTKVAQDFIDTEFDICINIASENVFPLHYIAGLSKARLKVGPFSQELSGLGENDLILIYDILLRTEVSHDQVNFLETIHEYLTILNPKEDARSV